MSTLTEWEKTRLSLIDRLESGHIDASRALKALEGIEEVYARMDDHRFEREQLHALLSLICNHLRKSLSEIQHVYEAFHEAAQLESKQSRATSSNCSMRVAARLLEECTNTHEEGTTP